MKNSVLFIFFLIGTLSWTNAKNVAPACPTIQVTGTNTSCNGVSDGTATVQIISGGSGNYTHTWSDGSTGSAGSSTINFLSPGTYTVSVKDNVSGCTVVGAYVVGQPDPINITGTVSDVNCFGDPTGDVTINVSGGNLPYSYLWNTGATTQNLSNVVAGTYTLTVEASADTCSSSQVFVIEQPTESLNSSATTTNADCFGTNTGAINVSVWGGTPPYSYSWDSGQNTQDLTGLSAGTYTLTITDNKGCTTVQTYAITQPNQLTGTMSAVNVNCFGDATGTVSITPNGGTAPYSYSWQNSQNVIINNSPSLINAPAETYQVTVTDANGCTFSASEAISQPAMLSLSADVTDVDCNGGTDGIIDLTVTGGVGPFDYLWTNSVPNSVGNNQDLINIPAEQYSVEVTDNNGCIANLTEEVTEPPSPIQVSVNIDPVLCFGENTGAIDLTVSGGTPNYTFSWGSGQITEDISNLLAGSYSYTVIDANNCTESGNVVITQPSQPLAVTNSITNVNCFGESNGSIDLSVTGGTPNYSFEWSNSSFQLSTTSEDLINVLADDYRFEITDENGCKIIDTLTITEPPLLTTSLTSVDILCKGGSTGSIDLTVMGGTNPYIYAWSNGLISEDLFNLNAGFYDVLVTDDHGCEATNSVELTEPQDSLESSFTFTNVTCNDGTDGEILLDIIGGTPDYDIVWSTGDTVLLLTDLVAGTYDYEVIDNNGCQVSDTVIIDQPDPVTLNETITNVSCFGLSDGIIDIAPTGGTSPYSFTWYNSDFALSAQTEDLVDFPAEIYQLEIEDTNGCRYEMFLEITEPEIIEITYTFDIVSCSDGDDANIDVSVVGGTPAYDFTWSNGATTEDLTSIPAGTYSLDLVDQNGCEDSLEVEITQPVPLSIAFETTDVTCEDQFDGTAYATAAGGNGGYEYTWENGTLDAFTDQLASDWHAVEVVDILGCSLTDSVFIDVNPIACIDPVNTFTPNEDNYNDTWVIDNMALYPDLKMQIFNKWGNLIHTIEKEYTPWDGTYNGAALPAGVYYWTLYLNNEDKDVLKGNITIIR
jgi:gliding motility-associated-like protein